MTLDYTTLALFGLLQNFAVALGFSLILLVLRRQPILWLWAAALWLIAFGMLLAVTRSQMPELLSIVAGNACGTIANMLLVRGISQHVRRRTSWAALSSLGGVLMLVLILFSTVWHNLGVRIIAFAAVQVAWDAWAIMLLLRHAPRGLHVSCRLAAVTFAFDAFFQVMRLVIPMQENIGQDILGTGQAMAIAYVGSMLLTLAECFALVLLIVERLMVDLRRSARVDGLTGLLNRAAMAFDGSALLARCLRRRQACTAAVFDLDHFKRVNDTWGHEAGDVVLRRFADITSGLLAGRRHLLGRWGGEEFVLLLPAVALAEAQALAEQVRVRLARSPVQVSGQNIAITTSVGLAQAREDHDLDQLVAEADAALYQAKAGGRNRVVAAEEGGAQG